MRSALVVFFAIAVGAAAQTCETPDLMMGSTQGSISDTDCALRQYLTSAAETLRADAFQLRVSQNTVYTIKLTSTQFDPLLYIFDSNRRQVARDNNSGGGKDAEFVIQLQPGTYTVLATTSGAGSGDYTLTAGSEAPRRCLLRDLTFGVDIEADLTSSDCRYADLYYRTSDKNYLDVYRLTIEKFTILDVQMTSTTFDTLLALTDESGEEIAYDDDSIGETDSRIFVSLKPGVYYLEASSSLPGAGPYRLQAKLESPRECPAKDLRSGSSLPGELTADDCRILDLFPGETDTTVVDVYSFEMKETGVVKLAMSSNAVDSFIAVLDSRDQVIAANDDISDGVLNSESLSSLRPGSYRVLAFAIDEALGSYEISLTPEMMRTCNAEPLAVPGVTSGSLVADGCRRLDASAPSSDPGPAAVFRLSVPTRSVVSLDLAAASLQPALELQTPTGESITSIWRNGRASVLLLPGTYPVIVSSADGKIGDFSITAGATEPKACPESTLQIGTPAEGTLRDTDCRAADVLAQFTAASPRINVYKLEVAEAGPLTFKVTSRAFPPLLAVLDRDYAPATVNINETLSTTVEKTWTAQPGTYYVAVTDVLGLLGPYTLSVTRPTSLQAQ